MNKKMNEKIDKIMNIKDNEETPSVQECSGAGLIVTPEPRQLTVRLGEEVNLLCNSNKRNLL